MIFLRPPRFWYRPAFRPFFLWRWAALLYAYGTRRRLARGSHIRLSKPVLCVGGLSIGGSGKTPTALYLADFLRHELGLRAVFLTRGYGGRLRGPLFVTPSHTAAEVGDEPLLLAAQGPTVVARLRTQAAPLLESAQAELILQDDGFQNGSFEKTLSFLVIDERSGFGNGYCVPAGPLREPVEAGLKRCDAIFLIGSTLGGEAPPAVPPMVRSFPGPLFRLRLGTRLDPLVPGTRVYAFAGLGVPDKFFASLAEAGLTLEACRAFPDHYPYRPKDIQRLEHEAGSLPLVTTPKDYVRLVRHLSEAQRRRFHPLAHKLALAQADDGPRLRSFLKTHLQTRRP